MPLDAAEDGEHGFILAVDRRGDVRCQHAQLRRVLESPCLLLEARVLTVDELRFLDLLRDVAKIVGTPLGFCLTTHEIGNFAPRRRETLEGAACLCRRLRSAGKDVEDSSL